MLSYLPFGLSKDEGSFLVSHQGGIAIGNFLNAVTGAVHGKELERWAKSRLGPRLKELRGALADQYRYTNDDWFMKEELLDCLRAAVPDLSGLDDDRCLLLAEKNFSGKLNALGFWSRVSGETTFLSGKRENSNFGERKNTLYTRCKEKLCCKH